jgi:hypothetical protein
MKKIIIAISFVFILNNSNGQIFLPTNFIPIIFNPSITWNNTVQLPAVMPPWATSIGNVDTLNWLQIHIQAQSTHFTGKQLSVLWDSLYGLRWKIAEFDPPINIAVYAGSKGNDKDSLFANDLTFYFAPITNGGIVDQLHDEIDNNNLRNHTNNVINTHVKYFKVTFQTPVAYLRSIARSKNGKREWEWGGFQEYFWGGRIVQSVTVGEY